MYMVDQQQILAVRNCNGFNINEVTYNSELMVYYINGGYNEMAELER